MTIDETERDATSTGGEMSADERVVAVMARRKRGDAAKKATGRADWTSWPAYDAAANGLRNYWYPVYWSAELGRKPVGVRVFGENVVLQRGDDGKAYGLHDRCLHRGVPLSMGKEEFPNTITCPYHAWTFDLRNGELVAVITDGRLIGVAYRGDGLMEIGELTPTDG